MFNLGKYVAVGVNNPQKYPKKPFTEQQADAKQDAKPMTPDKMAAQMRRNVILSGGQLKKKKDGPES